MKKVMIQCLDEKELVQVNILRKREDGVFVSHDVKPVGKEGATFTVFDGQELRVFEIPSGKKQEELPLGRPDVVRPQTAGGKVGAQGLPPQTGGARR
jgi:hypothetical protein